MQPEGAAAATTGPPSATMGGTPLPAGGPGQPSMTAEQRRQPRRNLGLDALRCAAIAVVLANHGLIFLVVAWGHVRLEGGVWLFSLLTVPSVEWLFVLSGFLIGTMMIRTFEAPGTFWGRARGFWLRRWFRTVPNYYLFLVVNLVLLQVGWAIGDASWKHAVFAQNLAWREDLPVFFIEAWSLALDEWFYLVLPLLVGIAARATGRPLRTSFLVATVALITLPMVARLAAEPPSSFEEWDLRIRRVTVMHLDATGWGVLGAAVSRWHPKLWSWRLGTKAAIGLVVMAIGIVSYVQLEFGGPVGGATARLVNGFGLGLIGLGTLLALPWIADRRITGRTSGRLLATVSNYSYSIYLIHLPVAFCINQLLPVAWGLKAWVIGLVVPLWLALVVGGAALVHHTFEKPISDQRERFTRRIDASPFGPATPP